MHISEKELEDLIYDDLRYNNGMTLSERGFNTVHKTIFDAGERPKTRWLRQVNLGEYGIADIIGYYRYSGKIIVELFELKIVPIESEHFNQILRYRKAIDVYFGRRFRINFFCYLVGTGINNGHYIQNSIQWFNVVEFNYGLDGVSFESHSGVWAKVGDEKFNFKKSLKNAEAIHGY